MTRRVTVIHPWLPQYRVEFFSDAINMLAARGVELTVAHGSPPPDVRSRRDEGSAPWATSLPTMSAQVGQRALMVHRLGGVTRGRDLVIAEHAIRNLETYAMAVTASGRGHRPRLALWGHGRTYTKASNGVEAGMKDRLARRAHWFFSYTQGGADHVASLGVAPERITVVQNSVDTEHLQVARRSVTEARVVEIQRTLGLTPGRTALSVGALDASKRIDVLLNAGEQAALGMPGFTLLVAGAGPQEHLVRERQASSSWLRYVGPVFGPAKAELAAAADLMLIAGRVGLVAVDSFALELPVVTCAWPWHAPEFEYLRDGVNAAIVQDSAAALGRRVVDLLADPVALDRLRSGCGDAAATYTLEAMVERFCDGVCSALKAA